MQLENKTAFITGANRGLGKGFVEFLLSQNARVFAGVRSIDDSLSNHPNLRLVRLDVADNNSIDEAVIALIKETDHLDFLVNNAGVNKETATGDHKELVSNLPDLDRQMLLHMFDVNAVSPLIVLQKFLPLLKADPSFVINISSLRASFRDTGGSTGNYGYRASKAALNMLTLCSLIDLPSNVQTFAVHPGNIKSDMNPEGAQQPIKQAKKIMAITANWNAELNGKFLNYDGTLHP